MFTLQRECYEKEFKSFWSFWNCQDKYFHVNRLEIRPSIMSFKINESYTFNMTTQAFLSFLNVFNMFFFGTKPEIIHNFSNKDKSFKKT